MASHARGKAMVMEVYIEALINGSLTNSRVDEWVGELSPNQV